jgi:hypothetical protein
MDESGRPLPMICGSGVDAKLIKKFCFLNEFVIADRLLELVSI